jgi:HD-GYP domain-containing protein (c-di-GMP phosphodiesterase class II)
VARILLIGPARDRAAGVRSLLRQGRHQVTWLRSIGDWRTQERALLPDVVVAAVETSEELFAAEGPPPAGFPAPMLLVQHESDFPRDLHVEERLVDRLASPYTDSDLAGRVDALARVRRIVLRDSRAAPEPARGEPSQGFLSWMRKSLPPEEHTDEPYLEVAARAAEWSDRRDAFRPGHAERVTSFCAMIAESLAFEGEETASLLRASMLHDIGKIALPVDVLHQRDPLAEGQLRLIRTHPARGAALLRALDPDTDVARVVLYHHERPDGTGYYGKDATAVPRAALAIAVAETYDAMTSSLLRDTLSPEQALALLAERKGTLYDADAVDALAEHILPRRTSIQLSPARPTARG